MTRRQLLTTVTAAIAAPALAASSVPRTRFDVRVIAHEEIPTTIFSLTYRGPKGTQELWGIVQKNGRYLITDLNGTPVDSTVASLASMAMAAYFLPENRRFGKRYTYTLRTRKKSETCRAWPTSLIT